jgi:hypothetical protein
MLCTGMIDSEDSWMTSKKYKTIYHQMYITPKQSGTNYKRMQSIIDYNLNELEKDLKQKIDESLDHVAVPVSMPDVNNFNDFYNTVVDREKKMRLQFSVQAYPNTLVVFNKSNSTDFCNSCTKVRERRIHYG